MQYSNALNGFESLSVIRLFSMLPNLAMHLMESYLEYHFKM